MWNFLGKGEMKVSINGPGYMTKIVATPIYGTNLKISSSLEPKVTYVLETWHGASGTQGLQMTKLKEDLCF